MRLRKQALHPAGMVVLPVNAPKVTLHWLPKVVTVMHCGLLKKTILSPACVDARVITPVKVNAPGNL
jgi:hypothetical protein